MQETQVPSLGEEDPHPYPPRPPLEKEMAISSSILVWESPWTEELARGTGLSY